MFSNSIASVGRSQSLVSAVQLKSAELNTCFTPAKIDVDNGDYHSLSHLEIESGIGDLPTAILCGSLTATIREQQLLQQDAPLLQKLSR